MMMQVGDMVKWASFDDTPNIEKSKDIGIIVGIEIWDTTTPAQTTIEVYFFKAGHTWCNPNSLEIVSSNQTIYETE